jgi:hypothetical protein
MAATRVFDCIRQTRHLIGLSRLPIVELLVQYKRTWSFFVGHFPVLRCDGNRTITLVGFVRTPYKYIRLESIALTNYHRAILWTLK